MEPIFGAEERVPGAWSLVIFYGDFTRRDWSFPEGPAIKTRGAALTHGLRLLGSKRVSNSMGVLTVFWPCHVCIRQFPISDLAGLDKIGGLCKQDLSPPRLCW